MFSREILVLLTQDFVAHCLQVRDAKVIHSPTGDYFPCVSRPTYRHYIQYCDWKSATDFHGYFRKRVPIKHQAIFFAEHLDTET